MHACCPRSHVRHVTINAQGCCFVAYLGHLFASAASRPNTEECPVLAGAAAAPVHGGKALPGVLPGGRGGRGPQHRVPSSGTVSLLLSSGGLCGDWHVF